MSKTNIRDLSQFQCPSCGTEKHSHRGRKCTECGYEGDWIQPHEIMTYADNKKFLGVESIADLAPSLLVALGIDRHAMDCPCTCEPE